MLAGVLESPDLRDGDLADTIDDSTAMANKTKKNIPPVDALGNLYFLRAYISTHTFFNFAIIYILINEMSII